MAGQDDELAALAGFTVAFFKSDPGLWTIFQKAKKEGWTGDRLLAAARNTKWFKRHNEAQRQAQLLKTSDPSEYRRRKEAAEADIRSTARSLGLKFSTKKYDEMGRIAFVQGWSSAQIENYLRASDQFMRETVSRREANVLKRENPAEWTRLRGQAMSEVESIARSMGLSFGTSRLREFGTRAFIHGWTPARIESELRDLPQFRHVSETGREIDLLRREEPAEYKRRFQEKRTEVIQALRNSGLQQPSSERIDQLTSQALRQAWGEQAIINAAAQSTDVRRTFMEGGGTARGRVAQAETMARQLSQDYGIKVTNKTLATLAIRYASGEVDENFLQSWFTDRAKRSYPGLAAEIDAGMSVRDIAEPYIDAMGRILEVNPRDLNVFQPRIRRALTARDAKGKPTAESLWEFENGLRQDPRWNQTNNARESLFSAGHKALQDMGVAF